MTPLEGLVMGTRPGDVDAGVIFHLLRKGRNAVDLENIFNRDSGLKGISGLTNDMREPLAAADNGDTHALEAISVFCYRIKKYIGDYTVALGGLDVVVFTGGIGENSPEIRARIFQGFETFGMTIDHNINRDARPERGQVVDVAEPNAKVRVLVIPADEERMIARNTLRTVGLVRSDTDMKVFKTTPIPLSISAHHIHLTQENFELLFGKGKTMTPKSPLSQPGQFAAEETVDLIGPKGTLEKVRTLGPARKYSQLEISRTEQFKLGIDPPIRDSGDIEGTPGITVVGPRGEVRLDKGVICAKRHIHMSTDDALKFGLRDKDVVRVRKEGGRGLIFGDVLIRVDQNFRLDMHLDTDEGNAAEIKTGDTGYIESIEHRQFVSTDKKGGGISIMAKIAAPVKDKAAKIKAAVSSVLDPEIKKTSLKAPSEPVKSVKAAKKGKAAIPEEAAAVKTAAATKPVPPPGKQQAPEKAAAAARAAGTDTDKQDEEVKKPFAGLGQTSFFKGIKGTWEGNAAAKDLWEYGVDMIQRQILFWDVMRQRGDNFLHHIQEGEPPVLQFEYETIIAGRTLENPVNYALLRIIPGAGMAIDPRKRPFVIVDPRAGHGPGIGGSKSESQVGVALQGGHPVYFVMSFPKPEPGQTLNDVGRAEHLFLQEVIRRHPEAEKPCVMGNCQAGWAVVDPDIMGTIILNGAPMSYWAGYKNKNPMRYSGGLLGGKWLTTLTCDLGNGRFDGAYLVQNFENLNPANTLFAKEYNLYAKIDTEAERYLHFEEWWSGFFLMNAEEIDAIVTNLFVGNKLAKGGITTPDGRRVNLKNIKCPIVIFASFGDNITPPQQALNWIVDVYGTDEAILKDGQVIIYTLHPDVGHLGIFVGASIARKQHAEFVTTLEMIDGLPPGLYEMILEKKNPFTEHGELIQGDFVCRFEMRKIKDIMALNDSRRDDDYFASVVEVSYFNDELYRTFLQPWVRMITTERSAEMMRWLNKSRMKYYLFSERVNPFMATFKIWADWVRKNRKQVSENNYFLTMEQDMAQTIENRLNGYRDVRDDLYRNIFKAMYGPLGLAPLFPARKAVAMAEENEAQEAAIHAEIERLRNEMDKGGFDEALIRLIIASMIHIGAIDYRSRLIAKQLEKRHQKEEIRPEIARKMIWEQYFMLLIEEDRALASLAKLLPTKEEREAAVKLTMEVMMISDARLDPNSALVAKVAKVLDLDIKKLLTVVS